MYNLSNLPLILYLAAIPLISTGTTADRPALTWIGFLAILCASFITPGLRMKGSEEADAPATHYDKSGGKK
jgi:hypothetical protein